MVRHANTRSRQVAATICNMPSSRAVLLIKRAQEGGSSGPSPELLAALIGAVLAPGAGLLLLSRPETEEERKAYLMKLLALSGLGGGIGFLGAKLKPQPGESKQEEDGPLYKHPYVTHGAAAGAGATLAGLLWSIFGGRRGGRPVRR